MKDMGKSIMKSISDNLYYIFLGQVFLINAIFIIIKPDDMERFFGWVIWVVTLNMMLLVACRGYSLFIDSNQTELKPKKRESKDV